MTDLQAHYSLRDAGNLIFSGRRIQVVVQKNGSASRQKSTALEDGEGQSCAVKWRSNPPSIVALGEVTHPKGLLNVNEDLFFAQLR